jgi:hypothetical protein
MTERKINQASLENLKLGAVARKKGKVRCTVTILPATKEWLCSACAKVFKTRSISILEFGLKA